jgi:hypothetical protein
MLRSMPSAIDEREQLVSEANWGLIAFRRGEEVRARAHYSAAVSGFEKLNEERSKLSALTYMAREALRAHASDARKLASNVRDQLKKRKAFMLLAVLERAEIASKASEQVA